MGALAGSTLVDCVHYKTANFQTNPRAKKNNYNILLVAWVKMPGGNISSKWWGGMTWPTKRQWQRQFREHPQRAILDTFYLETFNHSDEETEHMENSRSREFSRESAWFFLARPWEMIFYFSFLSRSTRLKERISRSRLEKWDFHSNFSIEIYVLF